MLSGAIRTRSEHQTRLDDSARSTFSSNLMGFRLVRRRKKRRQAEVNLLLRCLLEGVKWLLGPESEVKVAGKSGISQARTRLGWEPLKQLHDEVVAPIAVKRTKGAWYRHWRPVSLDGSNLDVADNQDNEKAFGRPSTSRGPAPTRKCASYPWWKTGRMSCSARK